MRTISIDSVVEKILENYIGKPQLPEVTLSNFNGVPDELIGNSLHESKNENLNLAITLWLEPNNFDSSDEMIEEIRTMVGLGLSKSKGLVIINTLISPNVVIGNRTDNDSEVLYRVNSWIKSLSQTEPRIRICDWAQIISNFGIEQCIDTRYWYLYKQPFTALFYTEYARMLSDCIFLDQKILKVIVLDCDNTLWGGVVGELGADNILLGLGEYPSNVFSDFQKKLKVLTRNGVLLAMCTKNNESDILEVFEKNPNQILKLDDFVSTRINWENKASNIKSISAELNLGLDSFLFIDDSSFEISLVKSEIPSINTLLVPKFHHKLIYEFDKVLSNFRFNAETDSSERYRHYKSESSRKVELANFESLDEFLNSIGMILTIREFSSSDLPRVHELAQRTNQFNTSLKRFTKLELEDLMNDSCRQAFTLRAQDKYGDYGLVGFLGLESRDDKVLIDSFFLSCRVLGRRVEHAFLSRILTNSISQSDDFEISVRFIPTAKNTQVAEFLTSAGFHWKPQDENFIISRDIHSSVSLPYPNNYEIRLE